MTATKLPTLRALTRRLRELHEAWSHPDAGGEYVHLVRVRDGRVEACAVSHGPFGDEIAYYGREYIPGDDGASNGLVRPRQFDAVAAARRLLAAAKDSGK